MKELGSMLAAFLPEAVSKPVFSRSDLEEFATGSISRCFGPEFGIFEGRRYPRIPNGKLLLMDRVTSIRGERRRLEAGSSIETEFDVPPDAWFYQPEIPDLPPYSILMEMALQPCGLLSAYLGSSFLLPVTDLYFRNLDGSAELLARPDLRGQTVAGKAELLSSTVSGSTIIQKYRFTLSCSGQTFYAGEAVFGYFSAAGMANQVGLDSQKPAASPIWDGLSANAGRTKRYSRAPFRFLDEVAVEAAGGDHHLGRVSARQKINPGDWFYRCHFHQDAVMPGSLGVEAVIQALTALYSPAAPAAPAEQSKISFPKGLPFSWKYRGQILPTHAEMTLSAEITSRASVPEGEQITADASVWVDNTRIYQLTNLGLILK